MNQKIRHTRREKFLLILFLLIIVGGLLAIGFRNGWGCPRGGCL